MGTTVKTYSYNGSEITDTSVGIKFTDGSVSPKNWETVWSRLKKRNAKGITWTTTTNYGGGSASAEKLIQLREQRNMLLQEVIGHNHQIVHCQVIRKQNGQPIEQFKKFTSKLFISR